MNRSTASGIVFGVFVIIFGLLVLGHGMFGWGLGFFAVAFWALVIIAVSIVSIVHRGIRFWNFLFLLIGIWILLSRLNLVGRHTLPLFFAIVLMAIGIFIIIRSLVHRPFTVDEKKYAEQDSGEYPEYDCIFSSRFEKNNSKAFRGGRFSSVFGHMQVDLSDVQIQGNVVIDASAIFGTLELVIPRNVPYRTDVVPVLGNFVNRAPVSTQGMGVPSIQIKGAAVFGTVRLL